MRSVTSVTLSTWTRALHSCRNWWQPVAVIRRGKQEHVRHRTQADVKQSLTELVVRVRVKSFGGTSQELSSCMLTGLGSEVLALAPEAFFQGRALELARCPLRITVANGERINGGTHGAVVDLSVQIQDCSNQPVQVVSERVFVYKADVHEHLIAGYPVCKAYGLRVDPTRDLLVDALCGTKNRTAQHCSCISIQCSCRALAVSGKKPSRTKSYVARFINLASDSEDESLPRQASLLVHTKGTTVASVAAMYVTRFLPAITAAAAVSCSAALLCLHLGPTDEQTRMQPHGVQQTHEQGRDRCTECVHACVCVRSADGGLPDPALVREQHYSGDEPSEQGVSDEESDSGLPPTIVQSMSGDIPPDSFAVGWGHCQQYSGPWQARDKKLEWNQQPTETLAEHSRNLHHFCKCDLYELCGHCCQQPALSLGGGVDATPDPLLDRAAGTTSLLSEKLRTRFSEQCNKVHLTPMQRRIKLYKRVRQQGSYMYAAGRQMLLPAVRDEILAWAGLQDSKFIHAFSSRQTALFPKHWDVKADALIQDWSYGSQDKGDHTHYFFWLHCPHFLLQQTVDKILLHQSRGIMLLPVQKHQSRFWQMGEAAVD